MALWLSKKVFRKRGLFFFGILNPRRWTNRTWKWWLGGVFKYFLCSPLPDLRWEIIQFDKYFSTGLKPPTRWFGRWCSSSSGVFSGSMLIFWGVSTSGWDEILYPRFCIFFVVSITFSNFNSSPPEKWCLEHDVPVEMAGYGKKHLCCSKGQLASTLYNPWSLPKLWLGQ